MRKLEEAGDLQGASEAARTIGYALVSAGELDAARAALSEAVEFCQTNASPVSATLALSWMAGIDLARADFQAAEETLAGSGAGWPDLVHAHLAVIRGDWEAAKEHRESSPSTGPLTVAMHPRVVSTTEGQEAFSAAVDFHRSCPQQPLWPNLVALGDRPPSPLNATDRALEVGWIVFEAAARPRGGVVG